MGFKGQHAILDARGGEPGDEATKHVRFSNITTITPVPSPTLTTFQVLYINFIIMLLWLLLSFEQSDWSNVAAFSL